MDLKIKPLTCSNTSPVEVPPLRHLPRAQLPPTLWLEVGLLALLLLLLLLASKLVIRSRPVLILALKCGWILPVFSKGLIHQIPEPDVPGQLDSGLVQFAKVVYRPQTGPRLSCLRCGPLFWAGLAHYLQLQCFLLEGHWR